MNYRPNMNPEDPFHEFFKKFEKEIVEPIVAEIMKEQFAVPPPNLLLPNAVWKEDIQKNLTDICSAKNLREKILSAQVTILKDLKKQLNFLDYQKFQENWKQGIMKLIELQGKAAPPQEKREEFPPSLQSLMGITDETLSSIYDVGVRFYKRMDFHKASDIFYLVTLIDYLRHNAWVSLGLCEMENLHYVQALEAFGVASITDIDNPFPYIASAECSLELGKKSDSKQFLDLARAAILHQEPENRDDFLKLINRVQQKIK